MYNLIYQNVLVISSFGPKKIGPDVLACATRGGGRSEAGHCFHLLFFSFFFSYAFCFSATSRKLPCVKICFPQYFGITRRYMQKKNNIFLVIFIFLRKKTDFRAFFRLFKASVRLRPLGPPAVAGVLQTIGQTDSYGSVIFSNWIGLLCGWVAIH